MALNRKYPSSRKPLTLPTASGKKSGDPYLVGKIPVVLLIDADTASPYNASCALEGVFTLAAQAEGSDIAIGDKLYYDADDSTKITNDSSGNTQFGYAMTALAVATGISTVDVILGVQS